MNKIIFAILMFSMTAIFPSEMENKVIDHKMLTFNIEKISKKIKMINDTIEGKKVNMLNYIQTNLEILELRKEKDKLILEISSMDKYNFTIYKDKVHDLTQLFDYNKVLIREVREAIMVMIMQLMLLSLVFFIVYLTLVKIKTKNIAEELKMNTEFEDEVTLIRYHKIRLRTIMLSLYFGLLITLYLIGNVKFFLTTLSLVSAVFMLGVREQLGDMIVGILFNARATKNIMKGSFLIGDKIEFINNTDLKGNYLILKFNLFKTVLYNESRNEFISIRNTDLIRNEVRHIPLNKLHMLNLKYTIPNTVEITELNKIISEGLEEELKKDRYNLSFTEIRAEIPEVKNIYGKIPKLKNNLRFFYKSKNEMSFILTISFTVYANDLKIDVYNHYYSYVHKILLENGIYEGFKDFNLYLNEEARGTLSKKSSREEGNVPEI